MGKMSRISYLCETDNMKELIEEVGTELAHGFMLAHKKMRSKINDPAFTAGYRQLRQTFSKLNEITDEMQEKYRNEESQKKNTIDSIKATTQVIKVTPEYKVGKRIVFGEETEVDADYRDAISDIEAQDSYKCEHENKTYQAEEKDTNVGESYTCEDCGADLDIPEPDEDILRDR